MSTVQEEVRVYRFARQSLYSVSLATTPDEVQQCLRLRFRVFAEELGAKLKSPVSGIDQDHFDAYCSHLMVRENTTGKVIATTRLLTEMSASKAGGFYSETEFYMSSILALPGVIMEIGRTCIDSQYRSGPALNVLWQGVAEVMRENKVDYLMGCASIPAFDGGRYAQSVMDYLRKHHLSPESLRVYPNLRIPEIKCSAHIDIVLPSLLKTYLSSGAVICGELYWDIDFNVADAFILLDRKNINARFARHFMGVNA